MTPVFTGAVFEEKDGRGYGVSTDLGAGEAEIAGAESAAGD